MHPNVYVDLVGPLPVSRDGSNYLLTMIDGPHQLARGGFPGLGTRSFQNKATFLLSFPFFIKERSVLCVLFHSL